MTVGGGGGTGPSISILPIERPHVYVRKRWVRLVPTPVAVDMFLFFTHSSRTPVTRIGVDPAQVVTAGKHFNRY